MKVLCDILLAKVKSGGWLMVVVEVVVCRVELAVGIALRIFELESLLLEGSSSWRHGCSEGKDCSLVIPYLP